MQGLQEQNGHVSRPARMRLWRYNMEHTGGTTEVPNYCYQISDAGTVKNAIPWGNQIISSWSFIFAGSLAFTQSWAMSWRNRRRPRKTINWWPQTPPRMLKRNVREMNWYQIPIQRACLVSKGRFPISESLDFMGFIRLSQGAEPCKKWRATGHCLGIARIHQQNSRIPNQITWADKPQADRERPVYWAGTIGDSGPILNWFLLATMATCWFIRKMEQRTDF